MPLNKTEKPNKGFARKSLSQQSGVYTQTLPEDFTAKVNKYIEESHFSSIQELTRMALAEYIEAHPVKR